jgi:hypothetical protein
MPLWGLIIAAEFVIVVWAFNTVEPSCGYWLLPESSNYYTLAQESFSDRDGFRDLA